MIILFFYLSGQFLVNSVRIQGARINDIWKLDDGSSMTYFNWNTWFGQPGSDNFISVKKFLGCKWHALSDTVTSSFLCEIPL